MNSIGIDCFDLKQNYDICFRTWLAEHYLKKTTTQENPVCVEIFEKYKSCVKVSKGIIIYIIIFVPV